VLLAAMVWIAPAQGRTTPGPVLSLGLLTFFLN